MNPFCLVIVFHLFFVCHTDCSQDVELSKLPPDEFPKDNVTFRIYTKDPSTNPITPPHIFPENTSDYNIIKIVSILKDLRTNTNNKTTKTNQTDTEVFDLTAHVHYRTKDAQNLTVNYYNNGDNITDPEMDQELIESDLSKTEDFKLNKSLIKVQNSHKNHEHAFRGVAPVLEGQLAAILASVFALVAVLAYIGLLSWRRFLEHRYGNRELLINEEDYINYNDMKNFEL